MYNKNKRGPKIDPWGTPQKIVQVVTVVIATIEILKMVYVTVIIRVRGVRVKGTVEFEWVKFR
jgi:hypothetical protein